MRPKTVKQSKPVVAKPQTVIKDAYAMLRADDLEQKWKQHAWAHGVRLTQDNRTVAAFVNAGRWVGSCPNCNGGIACAPGQRGACLDCGHVYTILFPTEEEITQAEGVLGDRAERNRNWYPQREEVAALAAENAAHGLEGVA